MKNTGIRRLALLLALLLTVQMMPVRAMAEGAEGNLEPSVEAAEVVETAPGEAGSRVLGEALESRKESEKHFQVEDGSFLAVNYGIPVHYTLDGETWKDIDNTLTLQESGIETAALGAKQAADVRYGTVNGEESRSFAGNLSSGFLFSAATGEQGLQISLVSPEETQPVTEPETTPETELATDGATVPATEEATIPETEAATEAATTPVTEEVVTTPETEATAAETALEDAASVQEEMELTGQTEEAVPDQAPTTEETILKTEPETTPETEEAPESTSTEVPEESATTPTDPATEPEETEATPQPDYNRAAVAQISYPDRQEQEVAPIGFASLFSSLQDLIQGAAEKPEPSLTQQITPPRLRTHVVYEEVYPGVDFQYELYSYHIKETLLVKEPLASGYAFSFRLDLQGLTPELQEDGSVALRGETGEMVYWIPAPYMTDAQDVCSEAVAYSLAQAEDGSWMFTVTADKDWMEAEDRAYPVAIDPTLIDTTTSEEFEGTVCTTGDDFVIDDEKFSCGYHQTYGQMEVFFRLNQYPEVPAGHTLVRAYAGLYQNDWRSGIDNEYDGTMVLYMHANTENQRLDRHIPWDSRPKYGPVLDYINADYHSIDTIHLWDITAAAKDWYADRSANYGLALTSNATAETKCRAWFSCHHVYFLVKYRSTNGIEPYYTYQTYGVGNGGTAYLSDYTGQLTVCKELVSYASTVNPFSLELVYNSSYCLKHGAENYDVGGQLGLGMHLGAGVQLNVMQKVEEVELQNEVGSDKTKTHLKYTDGDGTAHYFSQDEEKNDGLYYDEDGLGLKINEYRKGWFKLSDDKDNEMYFVNGYLTLINDNNGNEIQIHYIHKNGSVSEEGWPDASGDRISKIVQKNTGGSAITIATLNYSSDHFLTSVKDAAGRTYTLGYTSGKLVSISRDGTLLAKYGMCKENSTAADTYMRYVYDEEAQYGIQFQYKNGQVRSVKEITEATSYTSTTQTGALIEMNHLVKGQTKYRDYGNDRRYDTSDDLLTYYTFDYAGRTVNAYTTDNGGRLLGASNVVYSGVGDTDRRNNRTLKTATVGVSAMNELRNHGFEKSSPEWTLTGVNGTDTNIVTRAMTGSELVRTGQNACKGWIRPGKSNTISASRTTDKVYAGVTYTFSAYVNTAQCTSFSGDGVYLKVSGNGVNAKSNALNYQTSQEVDEGWVRLSVTFTPQSTGTCTVGIYNHGAGPYFYVDDIQLERAEAPSSLNMVENGYMQYNGWGWTVNRYGNYFSGIGMVTEPSGEVAQSFKIPGDAYTENNAYQDVPIYQTGKTYVLSGWAKADAIPDNEEKAEGEDAAARDKYKQFGLRAELTYSDNSKEYHYVPFNSDVKEWQYASLAIVPKKTGTQVKSIRVICAYERNGNVAYFDNLSLTQEVAQTMKYDKEGKLVSVKSTGNEEETSKYENGNLKELVTGGNGTYTYDYDKDHNLKSVTNDFMKDTLTHDSMGNTLTSTMESAKTSAGKIVSSSAYTNGGNLLSKVTQRGNSISYGYSGAFNKMTGLKSDVTDPSGVKANYTYDAAGRAKSTSINSGSLGTVSYDYTKSLLTKITRTASGKSQVYNLTYDAFGNMTKMAVGSRTLMTYEYGAKNGLLTKQTYANGASTSFQYDALGRSTKTSTSSGDEYTYRYTGDGQLYELTDKNGGSPIRYTYNYDTIGRLIGTGQTGGTAELRASYQYDTNNRLTRMSYSIPGVVDNATESFYYNGDGNSVVEDRTNVGEGTLKGMALFSNSWITYSYDDLSRLTQRRVGNILDEHYTYLAGSETGTTTTLPETYYTTLKGSSTKQSGYRYTYDVRNNITRITNLKDNSYIAYAYDKLGQMQYATEYAANGTAQKRYKYYYDNAGNLTSWRIEDGTATIVKEEHTYTYGDSNWKDLLTAFDGKNITYDANGNPTKYYNGGTMTWRNGRQLASYSLGGTTYSYEYDVNGLRTRKTNADGGYTEYYIIDGLPVAEQRHYDSGAEWYTMRYLYDESNNPVGFGMQYPTETKWENYYFAKNVQGDIVAIYRYDYDASTQKPYGTLIATYQYDPWGNPRGIKDASGKTIAQTANHVATYNPFRYRGYRYDGDTGLYYLQSRYYDPMTCRFVNADRYASTGQGLAGCNMFAYCNNNPVCYDDPTGTRANGPTFTFVNDGGGGSPDPHDKTAGMVNGQGVQPFSDAPFGWSTYEQAGCGVIATYNMMQLLGELMSLGDIGDEYSQVHGTLLGGIFGVAPWHISSFLQTHNIEAIGCTRATEVEQNISEGDIVIFTVLNSVKNVMHGFHTMTAQYKDGSYTAYNVYNNIRHPYQYDCFGEIYKGGALIEAFVIKVD